jgi:malate synthase
MSADDVLTPDAIEFLTLLQRELGSGRDEVLAARVARAQRLRDGELPDFLEETRSVREGDWRVRPAPARPIARW